jgi:hypothetical protein
MKEKLTKMLLAIGGSRVDMPSIEEDLKQLVERGRSSSIKNIEFMKGRPSQCHENASLLWDANREICRIVTGYALAEGVWNQHSWCERGEVIVETTVRREAYFGSVLTPEECDEFYFNNAW